MKSQLALRDTSTVAEHPGKVVFLCPRSRPEIIEHFVAGFGTEDERHAFEEHLVICDICRRLVDREEAYQAAFREAVTEIAEDKKEGQNATGSAPTS